MLEPACALGLGNTKSWAGTTGPGPGPGVVTEPKVSWAIPVCQSQAVACAAYSPNTQILDLSFGSVAPVTHNPPPGGVLPQPPGSVAVPAIMVTGPVTTPRPSVAL